jgi:hypothetical protein
MATEPSRFKAYESVTVAATAIGFTAGSIAGENMAFVTAETAQMRWRADGTDPTSTEGHVLPVGGSLELHGDTILSNFRAIRTGGTSGVLKCSYGG